MTKGIEFKALILDMDGVLWRDTDPIGDLPKLFESINERGWKTVFVTNNATRSIRQYVEKLRSFGVEVDPDQIINSGLATGLFLQERFPNGGPVFAIGEGGLFETLNSFGFVQAQDNPLAVIVSLDRGVTYAQLKHAAQLIRAGVLFLATNPDPSLPTPHGYIPGTGAILAAVEAASASEAIVIGKPSPMMYQIALDSIGVKPENTLVVGDQMATDIAAGIEAGCFTALVLSGVTEESSVAQFSFKPSYIAKDLSQLIESL